MLNLTPVALTVPAPSPEPFVLLVDDHEPSLVKLQKVVEAAGYRCVATTSSPEALVVCDARRPALVVTDLSMPRLDGQGLARWLKARYPTIPIMLVTGELLDDPTQSAFRGTFAAVLNKPLQLELFLTTLDDLISRSARGPRP
jgi:CheY-like chemotaxis protein